MFLTVLLSTSMDFLFARFNIEENKVWALLDHCWLLVVGKVLRGWKNIKVAFVLKGCNLIQPVGFFLFVLQEKRNLTSAESGICSFVGISLWQISLPPRCVLFCSAAGPWSFELFVFPPPFTRFSLFFLEAQKSVPEVSIRKVRRRLSVFTLIARSDLLSVVKDIAGSVALSLTRVNWVSFSFSQQHRADRIKKREKSLSLSSKSQPTVYFMLFPFSTEPQTEWKRGKLYLLRSFSPKCTSSVLVCAQSVLQLHYYDRSFFFSNVCQNPNYIFLRYPSLAVTLQLSSLMQEEKHEAN